MSSVITATRPSQALRQRRESQRPALARTNTAKANAMDQTTLVKDEPKPYVIDQPYILRKYNGCRPSMVIHLYKQNFRINDSQDPFSYTSPMKGLLEHVRKQTVPHDILEELYQYNVQFYDGCLIIEVHDHYSTAEVARPSSSTGPSGVQEKAFSIHNYNSFITPSPFVPYPEKTKPAPSRQDGQTKAHLGTGTEAAAGEAEIDKENMPAPGQPASATQKQPTKGTVSTIVLFPTPLSHDADIRMLANTALPDMQTYRRNQSLASRGGATPTMAHPPTPLTSVPPTPLLPSGRSPKRQKMVLDETNVHEFESELINATAPKLYLGLTASLEESCALIDKMTPAHYKCPPPAPKVRKRTTAELAADEAEAADMQRFMLAGDERKASTSGTATNADEGQSGMRGGNSFEPRFSRFKTLESIKMLQEDKQRRAKEVEAMKAQQKAQERVEAEAQKRQAEVNARQESQNQQNQAIMQQRREQMLQQQQEQQQAQQARLLQQQQQQEAHRAASQAQQMPNVQSAQFNQMAHQQPQHSSPVVRQQTPLASSPAMNAHNMASHAMASAPMAPTSSSHGAGSPPRPASAISHHPLPMARNMSQQHSGQGVSRNGTPQMVQGTPIMNAAMPARNMTPQPRVQGSPNAGMQGTPTMMHTPSGQAYTPEQMQLLQRRQQMARMNAQQQAQMAGMQGSPNPSADIQQMALMRAQQQIQQQGGVPAGQDPQMYRQNLAQRMLIQLQERNRAMAASSPQNGAQMRPTASQPGGVLIPGLPPNVTSLDSATLRQEYARRKRGIQEQYGQQVPQNVVSQMRQLESIIRNAEMREGQAGIGGVGGGNPGGQPGMNAQAMHAMGINVPGGANASQQQMQQAMMLRRQQMQQQQHLIRMQNAQNAQHTQQLGQQQGGGQMNMGGMGNNMNAMINGGNMSGGMGGMQGMGQMNMGQMGGMQGMQGMGMGAAGGGGMSMQQMQQIRMQQAMARQQQQQQRPQQPGQDGGMEWNG
ncbi:hypothetical protein BU16DRAFT_620473 [Lophium mytilinum]|uniref:Spt20-like SEP domain-containing protein n=1 Tax=Lophium mytilinum TaxID=390894 RepID=A0A6A6QMA6_9PEZI|nr:hypothetical protein BU16DRAFT_620473 [Lophium mytilinum]